MSVTVRHQAKDLKWIRAKLDQLNDIFCRQITSRAPITSSDLGFLSLYFLAYSRVFDDSVSKARAFYLRKRLFEKIDFKSSTLFEGLHVHVFARIWKDLGYPEERYESFLDEIRTRATKHAARAVRTSKDFDLIFGSTGTLVAAIDLESDELIRAASRRLKELMVRSPVGNGFSCRSYLSRIGQRDRLPDDAMNLGIAHGLAGPMLASTYSDHPDVVAIQRRLLATFQNIARERDEFSNYWSTEGPSSPYSSWCGGDAGIGFAMVRAGERMPGAAGRKVREQGLKTFLRGSRETYWKTSVQGTHFCHGAAGLAQMSLRLYQSTRLDELRDVHLRWLRKMDRPLTIRQTFPMPVPKKRLEAFVFGSQCFNGFLGVGLSLLSSISKDDFHWDRFFLLAPR